MNKIMVLRRSCNFIFCIKFLAYFIFQENSLKQSLKSFSKQLVFIKRIQWFVSSNQRQLIHLLILQASFLLNHFLIQLQRQEYIRIKISSMILGIMRNAFSFTNALMRHQNYIFKMLQPPQAEATVNILSNKFNKEEPLTNAYYRNFPLDQHKRAKKWIQFWQMFAADFSTNQISVGCFDAEKEEELVGVIIGKDLQFAPQGLEKSYLNNLNFISPIIGVQESLFRKAGLKWQPILTQKRMVMDMWAAAVKDQHAGKGILKKMVECELVLGQAAAYSYAFGFATNFKSSSMLKRLNFEKIAEENIEGFELFGEQPFKHIQQGNKFPAIWIKKLGHQTNSQSIK